MPLMVATGCLLLWIWCCLAWPALAVHLLTSRAATMSFSWSAGPADMSLPLVRWRWRTDLAASQPFWEGWYQGLSDLFMGLKVPKLLVLADTNRLDTPLTVAQMQGRFQMQLVPQVRRFSCLCAVDVDVAENHVAGPD